MMEAKAVARHIRISPSKARRVIDLIRGKDVEEALTLLRFTPKGASPIVAKLVQSAVANAENNHDLDVDSLYVAHCYVDEGPTLKRIRPRARGMAARIRKRTSHITVILREKEG